MISSSSSFALDLASTGFAPLINVWNGSIIAVVGGGVAYAVDSFAHSIFAVTPNTTESKAIKAIALMAGIAAAYSLAPYAAIVAFTNEALILTSVIAVLAVVTRQPLIAAQAALIPAVGLFGRVGFLAAGIASAAVTTNLLKQLKEPYISTPLYW